MKPKRIKTKRDPNGTYTRIRKYKYYYKQVYGQFWIGHKHNNTLRMAGKAPYRSRQVYIAELRELNHLSKQHSKEE